MDTFTISQLAQFSGVKAHNIRMWEQRHRALQPDRTEGNTRYYNNRQLRRLLNLVSLQETGRKISELSSLKDEELFELLRQQHQSEVPLTNGPTDYGFYITQLVGAGMSYDTVHFEKLLSHCLLRFGMKTTYTCVIYPMLQRIGLLWTIDELPPAQEHFVSNLLRQKLFTAIDSFAPAPPEAPSWLLFLPENEFHEIGLLMSDFLLKQAGHRSLYLGANVPLSSVISAAAAWPPEKLLFFLVHRDFPESIQRYLKELQDHFPNTQLVLSCNPTLLKQVKLPPSIHLLDSVSALESLLDKELALNEF